MKYVEFLGLIDSQIETVPAGARDGVRKVFFQAWAKTFPKDSITAFLENVKAVHQKLLENEELTFIEDYYIRTICFRIVNELVGKEEVI